MDLKEFLISDKTLNRSELARRMWPSNKKPESYLSQKLTGMLPFTQKDAQRALKVLNEIAQDMNALTLDESYPVPQVGRPAQNKD
jgi:Lon protease-like protein